MEGQGPSPAQPGFGFPPRGFPSPDVVPERFGSPMFDDSGRGRGSQIRGRGRGFPGRLEEHKREDEEFAASNPKRTSRWSNPSPPPAFALQNNEDNVMNNVENAEALLIKENPKDDSGDTFSEPPTISQQQTSSNTPPPSDESTPNKNVEMCDSQQINSPKAADVDFKGDVVFNNSVEQSAKDCQEETSSFSPNTGLLQDLELTAPQSQFNTNESLNQTFDFDMSNITERRTSIEKTGPHLSPLAESNTECAALNEMEVDQFEHTREELSSELQQSPNPFNDNFKPAVEEESQQLSINISNFEQHSEDYERDKTTRTFLTDQKSSEVMLSEDHLCDPTPVVSSQANNQLLFDESSPSSFNDLETNFYSLQQQNTLSEVETKEENLGPALIDSSENVSEYILNPSEAFDMTPLETQEKVLTDPQSGSAEVQNNCEINEPTVSHEQNDNFDIVEENFESINPSITD